MIFKVIFKEFIACCIYGGKVKLIIFSEHLCNFPCFYKKQIFEVSENHNSLGMGEDKKSKGKTLVAVTHSQVAFSYSHDGKNAGCAEVKEGEPLSRYFEDS